MAELSENTRKRGLVLAVGVLGGLVMLDETVLGVSLPAIRSEMGLSATTTHWIVNAYMLAFTCFAAIGGKAIDFFGLRPTLVVSSVVFAVASLLAGFADGPVMLISMRVVQGMCAAVMFPLTLTATSLTFEEHERGRAIGILAGMATVFLAAGPLIGGILTDFLTWRWVFWINIPVVLAGVPLTFFLWREPATKPARPVIDRLGLVLLLVGLTALIFGLMEGPDFGWLAPVIISSLLTGVVGLLVFAYYEAKQQKPLIDVRLFRLHSFNASFLVVLTTQMSKIVVAIFVPHYLQLDLGYAALWAGIGTVVAVLPFPFIAAPAGKLADRLGSRRPVLLAMAIVALASVLLGCGMLFKSYWSIAPALLLWGIALPYAMVPAGRLAANAVPKEKQGEVSGLVITARLTGGTLGVTLGSVLLGVDAGFESIFWAMGGVLALCAAYASFALIKDAPVKT